MRWKKLVVAASALVLGAGPAFGVGFSESFSPGWFGNTDTAGTSWSIEGVLGSGVAHETLDMGVDFAVNDPRLGNSNGSQSGGMVYENGVSGNGAQWNSGDNEMTYIDYHMPVPNGTYTFNAAIDAQINWTSEAQPWGRGYEFYMGDASDLAYGTQTPHNAPTGPWQGLKWSGGANTMGTELIDGNGVFWNGQNQYDNAPSSPNGTWQNWNFTSNAAGNTINVTSGEVIFRIALRLKNADQPSPDFSAWAFDNLNVTLVPEPATAAFLALGALPLLLRSRRRR